MSKFQKPTGADLIARILIAVFCCYSVANSFGLMLSFVLPVTRDEAIMYGSLASFLVMALVIMWVFTVPKWWRALVGIMLCNSVFLGLAWLAKALGFNCL